MKATAVARSEFKPAPTRCRALSEALKDDFADDALRDIAINVRDEADVVVLRVSLSYSATPLLF